MESQGDGGAEGRFAKHLRERVAGIAGLAVTDEEVRLLEAHYELMVRWNRTVNLTTVTNVREAVERHYGEGLLLVQVLAEVLGESGAGSGVRIVDIGSGAGFPGFPVAVLRPEWSVTLVESHQRKAVFLKEAARGMGNVRVLARRAEEVVERFDWAISRAVSYRDLGKSLAGLAGRAALLTGEEEPPSELGFEWEAARKLPWGEHRYVRVGAVSRET